MTNYPKCQKKKKANQESQLTAGHGIKLINGHYICPTFSLFVEPGSKAMDEWFEFFFPSNVPEFAHQPEQEEAELNRSAWDTFSC